MYSKTDLDTAVHEAWLNAASAFINENVFVVVVVAGNRLKNTSRPNKLIFDQKH